MKTIQLIIKTSIIAILLLLKPIPSTASHIMGMDLTYKSLGNHQYEVSLSFYRDCNGSNAPQAPIIDWTGSCGSGSIQLQQIAVTDITPTCNGINGSTCNGGNGVYGVEEYVSKGILTLPAACSQVKISFKYCCRNYSITTLANNYGNKIYVETFLENSSSNNNAPVFTNVPVPFGCVNQPVIYNHGANDIDGDDLRFSMTDCSSKEGHSVLYQSGFSGSNPLVSSNGIFIDSLTGAISFTPSIAQVAILCVLVEEFRNGVKIGSVVRDIQFNVTHCSNTVPTLTGIDSTNNFHRNITAGDHLCFDLYSNDADSNQITSLEWNATIDSAYFFTSPSQNLGTFCWQSTTADTGLHVFTVNVSDNYCPLMGQNTYTFSIFVQPAVPPCDTVQLEITSVQDIQCAFNDGEVILTANGGQAPYNYQLIDWNNGQSHQNQTGHFENLPNGNYGIWVDDARGCSPEIDTFLVLSGTFDSLALEALSFDSYCHNSQDGAIFVNNTGPAIPYLYTLDGTHFQSNNHFTNLATGAYQITVIDTNGCSDTIHATIYQPQALQLGITTLSGSDCAQSNGTIQLAASGGSGVYHYGLQGQVKSSQSLFSGLAAGSYQFEIIDGNKCQIDTTIVVPEIPAFGLSVKKRDMPCFDRCEGAAKISVQQPTSSLSYLWNTGETTADISGLCHSFYSVTVSNLQGCSVDTTIKITRPEKIKTAIESTQDESCFLNDGQAIVEVKGGTSPYHIELINQQANYSVNNANGLFNHLQKGQHRVVIRDAQNCTVQDLSFEINGCHPNWQESTASSQTVLGLSLAPNPASDYVKITWQSEQDEIILSVLDGMGRVLVHKKITNSNNTKLPIHQLLSGPYYVLVETEDGQFQEHQKLLVL